jgi:hypothetical protein
MTTQPIGNGFFECRSDDHVGVGASEAEAYLNWYNTQVVII